MVNKYNLISNGSDQFYAFRSQAGEIIKIFHTGRYIVKMSKVLAKLDQEYPGILSININKIFSGSRFIERRDTMQPKTSEEKVIEDYFKKEMDIMKTQNYIEIYNVYTDIINLFSKLTAFYIASGVISNEEEIFEKRMWVSLPFDRAPYVPDNLFL